MQDNPTIRASYVSPNTDLLGWIIERAAGRRFSDLMSELVWQPMGAAGPAYITVDRLGAPRCAGGMCTTTRDLARVGQLVVEHSSQASPLDADLIALTSRFVSEVRKALS